MNRLTLNLEFGGAVLPVVKNEAGQDVVPLKPICDVIGLKWETQRLKLGATCAPQLGGAGDGGDGYFARRFGACIGEFPYAGQIREMVCIRLDRVSAFLNSLNPHKVRVNGNEAAADFLERKHQEWDDLLHAYESERGDMLRRGASAKVINIRTFLSVCREKRVTTHEPDRKALEAIAHDLAGDLGIHYQSDLLDSAG